MQAAEGAHLLAGIEIDIFAINNHIGQEIIQLAKEEVAAC